MGAEPRPVTVSQMKCYRHCPRLCRYTYHDLCRPISRGESLDFGTTQHSGLEAWWLAARAIPTEPCQWLSSAISCIHVMEKDLFKRARAQALMTAYHHRWAAMEWDGESMEVLAVEVEYTAPLINPATGEKSRTWKRGGKIDAIVRGRSFGRIWVVEHKTSKEDFGPGSDYRQRLLLDPQISHYHVGARALGYDVDGCIYDVMRRPAQVPLRATPVEQRKYRQKDGALYAGQRTEDERPEEYHDRILMDIAENPDRYLARMEVVRLQEDERRSAENDWQTALLMRESERRGLWPMNPGACVSYGRSCAFLPVCTGQASLNDGTRYRKAETAHEELSVAAAG